MHTRQNSDRLNQEGFAALVIAIVIILVLSLMTVGFAQLMRNEQRSALDKHLSSQAYYAAESGINDASKALNAGFASQKKKCGYDATEITDPAQRAIANQYLNNSNVGNNDSGVSYTCLLIDPAPTSVEFCSIDEANSKIVEIDGVDPNNPDQSVPIDHLDISWQPGCGDSQPPQFVSGGGHNFTPADNWASSVGVLRLNLTPLSAGGIDRATLINKTYAAFLYPNGSCGPSGNPCPALANPSQYPVYPADSTHAGLNGGAILDGNCSVGSLPRQCNVRLSGLQEENYLLDLRSIYKKSMVTIKTYSFDGRLLRIKNAQTLVDSTGKAQDVLRRVQVRIPTHSSYSHSDFGIDAGAGICKQLQVMPADPSDGSNGSSRGCNP